MSLDLEAENARLKQRIAELEAQLSISSIRLTDAVVSSPSPLHPLKEDAYPKIPFFSAGSLNAAQIHRYGRQLILAEVGIDAQSRICAASVLIVGELFWFTPPLIPTH